jgi:hypothetical protein
MLICVLLLQCAFLSVLNVVDSFSHGLQGVGLDVLSRFLFVSYGQPYSRHSFGAF